MCRNQLSTYTILGNKYVCLCNYNVISKFINCNETFMNTMLAVIAFYVICNKWEMVKNF